MRSIRSPRPRFWVITAAAALAAGLTASLGVWQLSRADQKQSLERQIAERSVMPLLGNRDLVDGADQLEGLFHRQIELSGQWVPGASVFLDNRPMSGRSGFILVTPLRLAGSGRVVVIQRGWVPRDFTDRSKVPVVPTPPGTTVVTGRLAPPPSQLFELGAAQGGPIRQNLDLQSMAADIGQPLIEASVLQTGPSVEGLQRDWPRFEAAAHKHHGYAFQWFAMCAVIVGLYLWFQLILPTRQIPSHGPDTR